MSGIQFSEQSEQEMNWGVEGCIDDYGGLWK